MEAEALPVNPVLIIVIVITAVLVYGLSWVFVIQMVHPDDKNQAWVSKVFATLGLSLAAYIVLLLPLDVASRYDIGGAQFAPFPMETIWTVAYITAAVFSVVIVPFMILLYETDEERSPLRRLLLAIGWTIVALIVSVGIVAVMYIFLGYVEIPVDTYFARFVASDVSVPAAAKCETPSCLDFINACKQNASLCYPPMATDATFCGFASCAPATGTVKLRMSVAVYIMAMVSWFGSFFFSIFGGVGFVSLPYDLIVAFIERPRRMDVKQFAQKKLEIKEEVNRLLNLGREFEAANGGKKMKKAKQRMFMNEFRARVYQLDNNVVKLITAFKEKGGNPCIPFAYLGFGILAIILSLSWLGQIILYMLIDPPVTDYMNIVFDAMNTVFPLFSTIAVALFIFYLLWTVLKGQMKVGMRIFLISIHPMALHETMMNSILFNTGLLIFCAVAAVQFSTKAFSVYAVNTAASRLFGVQIENLLFLQYFYRYNIFTYMLVGFAGLTLIFGIFKTCCRFKRKKRAARAELMSTGDSLYVRMDDLPRQQW